MVIQEVAFLRTDPGPTEVVGTLSDESEIVLFEFYADELSITEAELVGLTVTEARRLHHERDVEWLRSKGAHGSCASMRSGSCRGSAGT